MIFNRIFTGVRFFTRSGCRENLVRITQLNGIGVTFHSRNCPRLQYSLILNCKCYTSVICHFARIECNGETDSILGSNCIETRNFGITIVNFYTGHIINQIGWFIFQHKFFQACNVFRNFNRHNIRYAIANIIVCFFARSTIALSHLFINIRAVVIDINLVSTCIFSVKNVIITCLRILGLFILISNFFDV